MPLPRRRWPRRALTPRRSTGRRRSRTRATRGAQRGKRQRFPIEASAVPVLLPFDVEAYRKAESRPSGDKFVLGDFTATEFFHGGPGRFRRGVLAQPPEVPEFSDIAIRGPMYILFSGFRFTYALQGPPLPQTPPSRSSRRSSRRPPDLARVRAAHDLRALRRDLCGRDLLPRRRGTERILSCPQAARIADRFVRALHLPAATRMLSRSRRHRSSVRNASTPDFAFLPPGSLIPGTGRKPDLGGQSDRTVYAKLRFPLPRRPPSPIRNPSTTGATAISPAARPHGSQQGRALRMQAERVSAGVQRSGGREIINTRGAIISASIAAFRSGSVPAARDIRARTSARASASRLNEGADRCLANQQDAVAAGDGMILRPRTAGGVAPVHQFDERACPAALSAHEAAGAGRARDDDRPARRRGEVLGQIGNYDEHERGTTYHLHFDMQVPTRGRLRVRQSVHDIGRELRASARSARH